MVLRTESTEADALRLKHMVLDGAALSTAFRWSTSPFAWLITQTQHVLSWSCGLMQPLTFPPVFRGLSKPQSVIAYYRTRLTSEEASSLSSTCPSRQPILRRPPTSPPSWPVDTSTRAFVGKLRPSTFFLCSSSACFRHHSSIICCCCRCSCTAAVFSVCGFVPVLLGWSAPLPPP